MILIHIKPSVTAISSQITIGNLEPNTTYWWHQDTHRSSTPFTTDSTGAYTYAQDLTSRHLVFIKPEPSTKYITDNATGGDCTTIGTWNNSTKTCTLTTNLTETVEIENDGITLDGDGHSIVKSGTMIGYGVYVNNRSNVTIKNFSNISNFNYGISFVYSSDSNVINNTTSDSYTGIRIYSGSNNTLSNNTSSSNSIGIEFGASNGTVSGNTTNSNTQYGLLIGGSNNNIDSNVSNLNGVGISLYLSTQNALTNNHASNNTFNFDVTGFPNVDSNYDHDIDTTNLVDNKPIYYLKNISNTTYNSSTNAGAFYCISCNNVTVKDLSISNAYQGVYLRKTKNSVIENVSISESKFGIWLDQANGASDTNIITNNHISEIERGVILAYSNGNTISDNSVTDCTYLGIYLSHSNNNTVNNNVVDKVAGDWGINIFESNNNSVYENNILNHGTNNTGLSLGISDNNEIYNNYISASQNGIVLTGTNNEVHHNDISNNQKGIYLYGAFNSIIYNNNFLNNTTQVFFGSGSGNVFNLPMPTGGNYWSDFNSPTQACLNLSADRICDTPYSFTGGQDNYPWTVQDGWLATLLSGSNQYKSDLTTKIIEGEITTESFGGDTINPADPSKSIVVFSAKVSDLENDLVKLQIELKPFSEPFNGANPLESLDFVASDTTVSVKSDPLSPGQYHWQARVVDIHGNPSAWQEFGTPGNVDFTVKLVPLYTQVSSRYPSDAETATWFDKPYGTEGKGAYVSYIFTIPAPDTYSIGITGKDGYASDRTKVAVDVELYKAPAQGTLPVKTDLISSRQISWPNGDNQIRTIKANLGNLSPGKYLVKIIAANTSKTNDLHPDLTSIMVSNSSNQAIFTTNASTNNTNVRVRTKGGKVLSDGSLSLYGYGCGSTIGECGCYITSLVMMFQFYGLNHDIDGIARGPNGELITPKTLNDWLTTNNYYAVDGGLKADIAVKDYTKISPDKSQVSLVWDSSANINTDVGISNPLVAAVSGSSHFIVVSGKLGSTYTIRDPWWYRTNYLTQAVPDPTSTTEHNYANVTSSLRKLTYNPNGITYNSIESDIASPAELLATDPDGLRLGKDPATDITYNEIPDGQYFEEAIRSADEGGDLISHYPKRLIIPNPKNGDYSIKVTGTGEGAYTLNNIVSDDSNHEQTFNGNTNSGVSADYSIHYDSAAPSDITFDVGDKIAPTTAISFSGTPDVNGWYANTQVILSATDNAGGAGVYKVEYSLDNGTTWDQYSGPFNPPDGSAVTIKYRSEDYVGNLESTNSITIKVDQTPPEAKISFDPMARYLKVEGLDALGSTTVVKTSDLNYTITDHVGHTLKITLVPASVPPYVTAGPIATLSDEFLNLNVASLKYDSAPAIIPQANNVYFGWTNTNLLGNSILKTLQQSLAIVGKIILNSTYDSLTNKTVISKQENTTFINWFVTGMDLFKVVTNKGTLSTEY
ncbi:MAG: hypothetical protein A3B23_00650 [Candidatus Colwellbacteria bacterium RIFCSPLOWO2_01_FULL_48_10]|uniref:Carbohydrate-binding/sugar hydrolysis domain-containing protein n=1 Tax=Candidatus Colwellbacteria bacterium RIFCSPLOWO2_01_FULL_48_10 TaxID=1797690 RepID=A0A1G1Z4T8_9BACT|nr:MAG: hypothetical protein A3B23_00650 [Candidatus Colwellbacteria bacterium RIFCSPLOWO2_01_FULL_48_10]